MRDVRIMDIAMNLARIGNWAADDFDGKEKRIWQFFNQTKQYLDALDFSAYAPRVQRTLRAFRKTFTEPAPHEKNQWAEKMLTWSNILTHRAKLQK